ncbi:MAG TPA: sulfite exporter TauE/SafE family protein [Candidatus Omnitrophota bacterium]|nr:sulfite exporter TauE/SafE family protein [Candidatus Omnitrophota bacterium]
MLFQPLLAGFSVGAFCLTYCFPFMGAFLAAENRSSGRNLRIVLEFLGGRLAGYLIFGMAAGYLGERLNSRWLGFATDISFIVLSVLLCLYLLGILKEKNGMCGTALFFRGKSPLVMGFFMGINLCPPFLLSVAYIFQHKNPLYGMAYFTIFFLSSSVYFLPLAFVGLAARAREFRTAARLSGFLVAALFFLYGLYSIFHNNRI